MIFLSRDGELGKRRYRGRQDRSNHVSEGFASRDGSSISSGGEIWRSSRYDDGVETVQIRDR
jgi:hypothetical protein